MAQGKAKSTKASTPKKPVTPSDATATAIDESEIGEDALDTVVGGAALLEICTTGKHFPKVSL